ncbi:MAG: GDP-mannose 4,6-dehydratase, partial [Clostridia bacterium]|nr:GDP-mannose 4,6-dehydratase [Clostridia bacterium]
DWLHVLDHCKAIDLIIHEGKNGEIYNIGGHNERANIDVVKTVLAALGKSEDLIEFVTDRPGHDLRYAIDASKLERELGWVPETKFEDGIKETVEWYVNNQKWWKDILSGEYVKMSEELLKKT